MIYNEVPFSNFQSTDPLTVPIGCTSLVVFSVLALKFSSILVSFPYCSSSDRICLAIFNKCSGKNFSLTQRTSKSQCLKNISSVHFHATHALWTSCGLTAVTEGPRLMHHPEICFHSPYIRGQHCAETHTGS